MPKKIFVTELATELVNALNYSTYFSDNIVTSFYVQGDKIVGSFDRDVNIKKYLKKFREEIIKRHYSDEDTAIKYYKSGYFPLKGSSGKEKKLKGKNVKVVEFAPLMSEEVIHNLKLHLANEFQELVEARVAGNLEGTPGMTEGEAWKCVRKSVQLERTDSRSPYLYCISFGDRYCKEKGYPQRFLEMFRNLYIAAFDSRLEECGFNDSSVFFEEKRDNKLYIKDITNVNVIKDIVRYIKGRIAFDFKTLGEEDSKVENFKNILSELVFKVIGKFIDGYECDVFTDKNKIEDGHNFALIPLIKVNGRLNPLSKEDADRVNREFYKILGDIVLRDIKGKTEDERGQISNSEGPVYGFSNKEIAELLRIIMQSPIAYNGVSKRFELTVDLEHLRERQKSLSPEPPISPATNDRMRELILKNFISSLPLYKKRKLESIVSKHLDSFEGRDKLYSIFSSNGIGELCSSLGLSPDQIKQAELEWHLLHQLPLSELEQLDVQPHGFGQSLSAAVVGADKKDLIRAYIDVARFNANTPPYREQQSPPPPPISPTHESKQNDSGKDSWGKKISGVFSGLLRRGSSSPPSSKEASPTHDPGRRPPLPPRRTTTAWQAQLPKLELRKPGELELREPGDRGSVDSKNNSSGRGSASSSFLDLSGSRLNLPGDRGSVGSQVSKSSGHGSIGSNKSGEGYDDECRDSVPSPSPSSLFYTNKGHSDKDVFPRDSLEYASFGDTAGPSGKGVFPRNNETYASFMSNSSTSSGTSTETVIKSSAVMSRHNREHGPSLLYNETAGLAKRLGLEPPFEDYKYRLPRSRPERNNSPPPLQMSSIQVEQPKQQQTHAQREILRAKRLTGRGVVETSGGQYDRLLSPNGMLI